MSELGDLFNTYGSDKDRNGYTPVYHAVLKNIRNEIKNLLEVGIGTLIEGHPSSMVGYALPGYKPGGSLRAWRDYLPNAQIIGVDVAPDCMFEEERITTKIADSRDSLQVASVLSHGRLYDVVIDDGLHDHNAQLSTMQNLFPRVKPGGFYIIEDIYPGSAFFDELPRMRHVTKDAVWFTTERKNVVVFSL